MSIKYCYACQSKSCDYGSPIGCGQGLHPGQLEAGSNTITSNPTSAEEILKLMNEILVERGKFYGDGAEQERNMDKCVSAFNALSGHKLTVTDGWIFMNLLKLSRHYTGPFKFDNLLDGSNYMVLAAEEAANEYIKQGNIIEELK